MYNINQYMTYAIHCSFLNCLQIGELEDSGVRRLKDSKRYCFQRSSSDTFIMTTSGCLGNLCYIRLWHDNKGGGWYLR